MSIGSLDAARLGSLPGLTFKVSGGLHSDRSQAFATSKAIKSRLGKKAKLVSILKN